MLKLRGQQAGHVKGPSSSHDFGLALDGYYQYLILLARLMIIITHTYPFTNWTYYCVANLVDDNRQLPTHSFTVYYSSFVRTPDEFQYFYLRSDSWAPPSSFMPSSSSSTASWFAPVSALNFWNANINYHSCSVSTSFPHFHDQLFFFSY